MIGILTFNRAVNYGAVLQTFALKTKISVLENNVEIINYACPLVESLYKPFNGNKLKGIIKWVLFAKRSKKFYEFIADISSETVYKTANEIVEYDKIIVGSDQVWNYNCSGNDETFLLPFDGVKKYSYAASFGISALPEKQVEFFKEKLSDFRYISVREQTGKDICEKTLGVNAQVVLDPTLLLNQEEWANAFNFENKKCDYILVYSLGNNQDVKKKAKELSKKYDLPIYNISLSPKNIFGNKIIFSASPQEWVELFYNAKFVVTDSFHGTAFAVNFNKQFYSFAKNDRASRIVDLLELLGLKNRLNPALQDLQDNVEIDYSKVNEILEKERAKSLTFIEKIVND